MKKMFPILFVSIFFFNCKKDNISNTITNSITIKGKCLNELGESLNRVDLAVNLSQSNIGIGFRTKSGNYKTFPINTDGSYSFILDSITEYLENSRVTLFFDVPSRIVCQGTQSLKTLNLPFSSFIQTQKDNNLTLEYDAKLFSTAQLNLEIKGLSLRDSLQIVFENGSPCSSVFNKDTFTFPVMDATNSLLNLTLVPNRDTNVKLSKIKNGQIIKSKEWQGRLNPLESRITTISFD
jgi:hypothetical protein